MQLILPLLFVAIKIAFSATAVAFIYLESEFLLLVFLFFMLFDVVDSKLISAQNQQKYRYYDTIGDRLFMFANFIGFVLLRSSEYPVIIFIILPMVIRDLVALYYIRQKKVYYIESSPLDKITIFLVAVLFSLEASYPKILYSSPIILSNILAPALIAFQGYNKIRRIKHFSC